jgi:hypothetical protein
VVFLIKIYEIILEMGPSLPKFERYPKVPERLKNILFSGTLVPAVEIIAVNGISNRFKN